MTEPSDLSLRVQTPAGWVELLSSTHSIEYTAPESDEMEAGTLVATIFDVDLDPSTSETLESGQPIQLRARTSSGSLVPFWTGELDTARVSYPRPTPGVDPSKAAQITVTATDVISDLSAVTEPRSVATLDGLRRLLTTGGVAYRINGTTAAGPASPQVVAVQEGATLAQQVALTRDTVRGYAWVAADGVLEVRDAASMPQAPAVLFTDGERSPSYKEIDASYDSTDVLDEVSVEFLRYQPVAGQTEPVTYGPYRRAGAVGSNSRTVRLVGSTENAAAIEAFARDVLARNAVAVTRPLSITVPVKDAAQRDAVLAAYRCALVRVEYLDRVAANVRVSSVAASITATPGGVRWDVTLTFDAPDATQQSLRPPLRAPAVLTRIAATETAQEETAGAVAVLSTQVVELAEQVENIDTGPTAPPASSPAVIVAGLPDGLVLQLADPPEAGARVQYHVSTDQAAGTNFTPTAATAAGPQTAAGVSIIDQLPDGSAFVEGVTYYVRAVALNDLGAAPAGPGGSGQLNRNGIRLLVTAALVAGFILTGRIQIGQGYIDADEGFVIPNPDGTFSRFPFNGDPIKILAEMVATTLTVQGVATFLQLVRVLRRIELGDGISAPTEAPAVVQHWPAVALPAATVKRGETFGLVAHPSDASRWVTARPTSTIDAASVQVVSIPRTAGGTEQVIATTTAITHVAGITVAGGRYWLLGSGGDEIWSLVGIRTDATSDVIVRRLELAPGFPSFSPQFRPALGVSATGGSLFVAFVRAASGSSYEVILRTYTASTAADGDQYTVQNNATARDLAWIGQGDFNFGASRVVVAGNDQSAQVYSGPLTSLTRLPDNVFPRALGGLVAGMCWDGTRFRTLTGGQVAAHAAGRVVGEQITSGYAWAGQSAANGGGSTIETNLGPTRTATIGAQAQALVTVPTPPEADLPDPAVANRAAVYALTGGSQRRQMVLPVGSRAAVLDVISSAGRAAGTTGTFASSPGDLVPARGATNAEKGYYFNGAGYGRLGDLERRTDGTMVAGSLVATAVRQDTGWLTIPLRSGFVAADTDLPPQARRMSGVLYLRNRVRRTSGDMAAGTAYLFGDLPAALDAPSSNIRVPVIAVQVGAAALLVGNDRALTITPAATASVAHIAAPGIPLG